MSRGECPACGSEMGVVYNPQGGRDITVSVGDLAICMHCYTIVVFVAENLARVATQIDLDLMPSHERESMLAMQARIEREGIGGDRKDKRVRIARSGEPGFARVEVTPERSWDFGKAVLDHKIKYGLSDAQLKPMTLTGLVALASDPTKLALVIEMSRKGSGVFMYALEHEVFPPRSGLNHALEVFPLTWEHKHWVIMLLPLHAKPEALRVAATYGMRFQDGIPMACFPRGVGNVCVIGNTRPGSKASQNYARRGRLSWFPIKGDNAFAIENAPGCTPPEKREEEAMCNFIVSEWEAKFPKQEP